MTSGAKKVRVKFCGLVRPEDVRRAIQVGVDAVGFVFYPKSSRCVDVQEAVALRRLVPAHVLAVGLFVHQPPDWIKKVANTVGLDLIQFHGRETPAVCGASLPESMTYWKALHVQHHADLTMAKSFFSPTESKSSTKETDALSDDCVGLVLDSFSETYGGSGLAFNWDWIPAELTNPSLRHRVLVLSGGLTADSVGRAIGQVQPNWVDVSSGIQISEPLSNPRQKSPEKMEAFMEKVWQAPYPRPAHAAL